MTQDKLTEKWKGLLNDLLKVTSIAGGCDTCEEKRNKAPEDGHCCKFAEAPGYTCEQHKPIKLTPERLSAIRKERRVR